jgi:Family of unknown function (DUF6066)
MSLRSWVVILALSGPALAHAEAPRAFARLRDQAQAVESLSAFLSRYVGTCTDIEERLVCLQNARKARGELTGKLFHVTLDPEATRMLKGGAFNPATREYTIQMTPFFEAAGLALTDGAPTGQDAQGRPRIPIEPIVVKLPDDMLPMDMERLLRTMNLKIHLVFRPLGTWSLPGREGSLEGVKAKFLAVRLTDARTGDDIGLRLSE